MFWPGGGSGVTSVQLQPAAKCPLPTAMGLLPDRCQEDPISHPSGRLWASVTFLVDDKRGQIRPANPVLSLVRSLLDSARLFEKDPTIGILSTPGKALETNLQTSEARSPLRDREKTVTRSQTMQTPASCPAVSEPGQHPQHNARASHTGPRERGRQHSSVQGSNCPEQTHKGDCANGEAA